MGIGLLVTVIVLAVLLGLVARLAVGGLPETEEESPPQTLTNFSHEEDSEPSHLHVL